MAYSVIEPISQDVARGFMAAAQKGNYKHVEERTLHVSRAWATGDIAPSTTQQGSFEVLNNTSGNLVERTQNPPLTNNNPMPPELMILVCAVSCVIRLGALGTFLQAQSMQADLDRSILTYRQGGVDHVELGGIEFIDYGPPLLLGNDTTAGNTGRLPNGPRTIRRLSVPRQVGQQQTLSIAHSVARTSAWGVAFTADYYLFSLIARGVV